MVTSNWVNGTISIIYLKKKRAIEHLYVGYHPRGLAINKTGSKVWVTIMGADKIVEVNTATLEKKQINKVGRGPRSLLLSKDEQFLYVSLNNENKIKKINVLTFKTVDSVQTQKAPRSLAMSTDEKHLYVTNYFSNSIFKIETSTLKLVDSIKTKERPIGIAVNPKTSDVWVACYRGAIQVFKDHNFYNPTYFNKWDDFLTGKWIPNITPVIKSYSVIIGSFKNSFNASRMLDTIKQKGYEKASIIPSLVQGNSYICIYSSKSERAAILIQQEFIETIGTSAWILEL